MVGEVCVKCGAKIPAGGKFCLECGTPAGTQQAPAAPVAAPPPVAQPRSSGASSLQGIADFVFSKFIIMLGICIGALLAWIGTILATFWGGTVTIGGWTAGGEGATANTIMDAIGFGGIAILLLGGALLNKKIDQYVRAGMIIAGGLILFWAL